jgi:hypothetical protein
MDDDDLPAAIQVAHGLGLRVALQPTAGTAPDVAARADLALYPSQRNRDDALADALRTLPRTVGLRERFRVAEDGDVGAVLRAHGERLSTGRIDERARRVFLWVHLTVDQPFNTGVQRVARQLAAALVRAGLDVVPVRWDGVLNTMRALTAEEAAAFAQWNGPEIAAVELPEQLDGEWLVVPEITVPLIPPDSNVVELGHRLGMRVAAIFYDIIPAKTPENYPPVALEQLDQYWRSFADADVALPISWTVAADLIRWLEQGGLRIPTVVPCPLAGDVGGAARVTTLPASLAGGEPLRLLAIGTWEPRKNYIRLLRALAVAQSRASRPISFVGSSRLGFASPRSYRVRSRAMEGEPRV